MPNLSSDRMRERKACDAVARCLEGLSRKSRVGAYFPEDVTKGRSEIDYAFELGGVNYAFEHTVVEAFQGQLETNAHFGKFIEPIATALDYQMPHNGYFELLLSINPSTGMKGLEISRKQKEIIAWAKAAGCDIAKEAVESAASRRGRPMLSRPMPGADVTLSLKEDVLGTMGSRLMVMRKAPRNYEQMRVTRIQESINRKLPKLAAWKRKPARTVLVLENRDMALSNHWLISECLELALQGRCDIPDEVWLVDGAHSAFWITICLREGNVVFPHDDHPVRFREFKELELAA